MIYGSLVRCALALWLTMTAPLVAADFAVVTMSVGEEYTRAVASGIENKRLYCHLHNYDFVFSDHALDPSRPIPWSKIPLLLQVMENPEIRWVFWTDADSLIMNLAISLEDLIDEDYDFILSRDCSGINTGQFLIKNCAWSREFLRVAYNHLELIYHGWWEQQAIIVELEASQEARDRTKLIPQRQINSYPEELWPGGGNYRVGDFVIHFPGVRDLNTLAAFMERYSARVVNDMALNTLQ